MFDRFAWISCTLDIDSSSWSTVIKWRKLLGVHHSIFPRHSLHCKDINQDGFEEVRDVRPASRLSSPFHQSLRPDSTSQHKTSWSTKTLQVGETENYNSLRFPLRLRMMATEGLVKKYYHYADLKRSEILQLRTELSKVNDSETELDVSSDEEL